MKTILVSGCTRSGLTLMMQILYRGGYPCFGPYPSFEEYEFGKIDFEEQKGKAIKLVDTHNQLPPTGEYFVIRMRRDLKQQAKSMVKFGKLFGAFTDGNAIPVLIESLKKDYKIIDEWAMKQKDVMYVDFEVLLEDPERIIGMVNNMLGIELDSKAKECVVERDANCYGGMLELQLLEKHSPKQN